MIPYVRQAEATSPGPMWRCMGVRRTPSLSEPAISANSFSSNAPPVVESQTIPTSWPSATCASVRSRTCLNIPPTGERKQWTILSFGVTDRKAEGLEQSEQTLAYVNGISRQQRVGRNYTTGQHFSVNVARNIDISLIRARREAAGRGDRLLHGHARHVGILSGSADFAHDEDRPVAVHLDRDVGITQVAVAQLPGD